MGSVSVRLGEARAAAQAELDGFRTRALRAEEGSQRPSYVSEWRCVEASAPVVLPSVSVIALGGGGREEGEARLPFAVDLSLLQSARAALWSVRAGTPCIPCPVACPLTDACSCVHVRRRQRGRAVRRSRCISVAWCGNARLSWGV